MKENKHSQNIINTIKTTRYIFLLIWNRTHGKLYIAIKIVMSIINSIFPLINILLPGMIINELTNNQDLNILFFYIAVLLISALANRILSIIVKKWLAKLDQKLTLNLQTDFYDHISNMDYETLENPDIQIMQDRAQKTYDNSLRIVDQLSNFFSAVISIMIASTIIITLNPFIILLIIFIIYVNYLVTKKSELQKILN